VGSSGTDPPVEVREAEELAAGEPVSPSMPPPEDPVKSWQRKKRAKTPRTAIESVRSAERFSQTGTRSLPYALKTVGFVERASGETEAIVADEGGVYLVPVLGLEISPFMNRALTFPDLLPGMPTTTCSQNTPQTHW
jgi:hypothetical protein